MNLKYFFIINFLILNVFAKQNNQEIFLQANNFYKQGNFSEAFELYKTIPDPGPQVNYNLGNCAYKLNDFGYAMLYWKRAENNWGFLNRSELLDNIDLLKQKLFGEKESKFKKVKFIKNINNYFWSLLRSAPLFGVQILFLILWIFSFLYIRYLFKHRKKLLITVLFVFVALLGGLFVTRLNLDFKHYGIVVEKNLNVFSGPGENFQKIGILPVASQVRIQKNYENFFKVRFQGLSGWINKKGLERI